DDKSYPFIAISIDEAYPRVYFTRERHRSGRLYFGPYSNAKRVRATLEVLAKVFMFRSCTGPEPGRRSGSPCLDYYIKRCEAPCVDYVSQEQYRRSIDDVIDFTSGRFAAAERELAEVTEEFMLQYYGSNTSIPALLVVQAGLGERPALADALSSRRDGPVELRAAERGEKRRILELAERNAHLALDQERLRSERRRQSRVDALEGLQRALDLDVPPVRIECFDISNLGGTHTVA